MEGQVKTGPRQSDFADPRGLRHSLAVAIFLSRRLLLLLFLLFLLFLLLLV